jgi:hypothetical protein
MRDAVPAMACRSAVRVALLAVALGLAACGKEDLDAARERAGTVNGLCPVQELPVVPSVAVAEHQGQKIGFCCGPCRPKFLNDPETYLARMRADPKKYAYVGR